MGLTVLAARHLAAASPDAGKGLRQCPERGDPLRDFSGAHAGFPGDRLLLHFLHFAVKES
jgi:hypothetical protein